MAQVPILLINLDRSTERLDQSVRALHESGVSFERVSAIEGRDISPAQLDAFKAPDFSGYYKQLSAAELGCYFSHRKCWQYMLDNDIERAIILEDDFKLSDEFGQLCQRLPELTLNWECLKLTEYPEKRKAIASFAFGPWKVIAYDKTPCRTGAYAITLSGAKKMLDHSTRIARPVDIDFQYAWEHRVNTFGLKPYPVITAPDSESTIDAFTPRKAAKKSPLKQLVHSVRFKINNRKYNRSRLDSFGRGAHQSFTRNTPFND